MPDLISHIASGYLLRPNYRSRAWMALFLFGICLPDLMTRPFYIIWPELFWWVMPAHTPIGIVLSCLLLSGLFIQRQRNRVFLTLLAGSGAHLLLDLIQKHIHGGYALLFPFSWQNYEFGWIWPEDTLWLLPFWICIIVFVIILRKSRR